MGEASLCDLSFHAVEGGANPGDRVPAMFSRAWPAYRAWFLRDGEAARPSYLESRHALADHMPELLGTYDELVESVGGGDLEARFLSHWCPPPLFAACSLATWTRDAHLLFRSYDYPPTLCDRTLLRTGWNGTGVLAMSDCVWGALDGVNEHGLAAALAFGGRPVVGRGFGIGLVVRYLLQVARDVHEALAVLGRVPVQLPYNIALVDRDGGAAVAEVSPDRPLRVAPRPCAGNRQGPTEWPEHAEFCGTEPREAVLAETLADPAMTPSTLLATFLTPPLQRPLAQHAWGTVYTAVYDVDSLAVDLVWPDARWRSSLAGFHEDVLPRSGWVAAPPTRHVDAGAGPLGRPLMIA